MGYKILAINSLSSKMVTTAVVTASSHNHVVINAATTIASIVKCTCAQLLRGASIMVRGANVPPAKNPSAF